MVMCNDTVDGTNLDISHEFLVAPTFPTGINSSKVQGFLSKVHGKYDRGNYCGAARIP